MKVLVEARASNFPRSLALTLTEQGSPGLLKILSLLAACKRRIF